MGPLNLTLNMALIFLSSQIQKIGLFHDYFFGLLTSNLKCKVRSHKDSYTVNKAMRFICIIQGSANRIYFGGRQLVTTTTISNDYTVLNTREAGDIDAISVKKLLLRIASDQLSMKLHNCTVVYFNQRLGAAHSKCWSKFSAFLLQKT